MWLGLYTDKDAPADPTKSLDGVIQSSRCYDKSNSPKAKAIRDEAERLESELEMTRNQNWV